MGADPLMFGWAVRMRLVKEAGYGCPMEMPLINQQANGEVEL